MADPEFQLTVRKGPKVGQVFYLDARSLIIGRDPLSDIIINDPEVSRQHARISQTDDGFQIEDLGSTNGTFVEGKRLESDPIQLEPGQAINMGSGVRVIYEEATSSPGEVETLFDAGQAWPNEEADTPERLATNPANEYQAEPSLEEPFPPPFGRAEPDPEPYSPPPPTPAYEQPYTVNDESNNNTQRNAIIAVSAILLLCCCCSFIAFMYQWGGDMLLEYLGMYP